MERDPIRNMSQIWPSILYPASYCPNPLQLLLCAPWRNWMLCKSSCPQSSQSNLHLHSIIQQHTHNKSWEGSVWRLQTLSEHWKDSIKMVVTSWSRKFSMTLGKHSSLVLSANVKLNITLISEGNHWFHLFVLLSCPILVSPLSCVLLWSVAFHGSHLKPADMWASRKDHISASKDGFSILSKAVHLIQSVRSQGQRTQGKHPHWLQLGLDPICYLHFTASGNFVYQLTQRESTPK